MRIIPWIILRCNNNHNNGLFLSSGPNKKLSNNYIKILLLNYFQIIRMEKKIQKKLNLIDKISCDDIINNMKYDKFYIDCM